jgi:CBS domain-containing protein
MSMAMGIGSFCVRDVITVTRHALIVDVAALMRRHHIGAVVIVNGNDASRVPVGIVTDRDIVVEIVAAGLDAGAVKVGELLQRPLTTVREEAGYAETVRVMAINGIRRVPVVDARGNLCGIITLDDILRQLAAPLVALGDISIRERHYEMETRR